MPVRILTAVPECPTLDMALFVRAPWSIAVWEALCPFISSKRHIINYKTPHIIKFPPTFCDFWLLSSRFLPQHHVFNHFQSMYTLWCERQNCITIENTAMCSSTQSTIYFYNCQTKDFEVKDSEFSPNVLYSFFLCRYSFNL